MFNSDKDFESFARSIADANQISIELARQYAELIGDTPELDDAGRVVVRDQGGAEIARITLPQDVS